MSELRKLVDGVRFRHGEFQLRCQACKASSRGSYYWPITLEFWDPDRGMARCRACWATYQRLRMAAQRARDPEIQKRKRRQYYQEAREIILAKKRRKYYANHEEMLAKKRAAYAAKKAANGQA